jgi:hypothetical protein
MTCSIDLLEGQLHILRSFNDPLKMLHKWIAENVRALTDNGEMYAAAKHIEFRLRVQHEILQMVQEGKLDEELNRIVGNSDDHNEEEAHVSN